MNTRQIATLIVRLRRLLQLGMIAELRDDVVEYDRLIEDFETLAQSLPMSVLLRRGLERRVSEPSLRKVEREGILAQAADSDHHHHYLLRDEIATWLCHCGASYMGARR